MSNVTIVSLITTKNEESNIETAVKSIIPLTKTFLIIDSYSTDKTTEIAQNLKQVLNLNLDIVSREYKSPTDQKNWGIDWVLEKYNTEKNNLYILILDADEELTPSLIAEIRNEMTLSSADCYYIPRANFFMGQFIKHSNWYPDYNLRFFRGDKARYEDVKVHEHMIPNGSVKYLKSPMNHNTYISISQYFEKMNRYTDWEVDNFRLQRMQLSKMGLLRKLFVSLPGRPILRALYMYIFKLGFLDGRRGFHLAVLSGIYEWIVNLKRHYSSKSEMLKKRTL